MSVAADGAGDRKTGLAPVADAFTEMLVLGSLPGDASLKAGQYYGHPRNAFWALVGTVIGRDLARLSYPERLEALKVARIGLWDVIASARRAGSLDQAIRGPESADLRRLIATLPRLRTVAFNGGTAARLGRRTLAGIEGLVLIDLPSSSPAHTLPFAIKAERWRVLGDALRARDDA